MHQSTPEQMTQTTNEVMHDAFGTSSEKEDEEEEGQDGGEDEGQKEDGDLQQPVNYMFSLIFKLNFC
jgi:hypothetical protein